MVRVSVLNDCLVSGVPCTVYRAFSTMEMLEARQEEGMRWARSELEAGEERVM
jgi:hypothetical protein